MPCNSIAVATAKVDPKLIAEVLQSLDAFATITNFIKAKLGAIADARKDYWSGQAKGLYWRLADGTEVFLLEDGRLQVLHRNGAVAEKGRAVLEPFVGRLGGLLLQEAVKAKIRAVATVQSESKTSGGAVVLSVSL